MKVAASSQPGPLRTGPMHGQGANPVSGPDRWSWVWILLSGATVAAAVFAIWEVIQQNYFQHLDSSTLHYLYITRGIAMAFFLTAWAACIVIAHRRASMAQLRQSEMKYRQLIEEARDAIVVFDRQGRVLEWNPQASLLFGYRRHEILGRPLPTVLQGTHQDFFGLLDRLAAGQESFTMKYATQKLTKRGEVLDVSSNVAPLRNEDGQVTAFIETSCDIRACAQLVRKLQQVEKMSGMGQLAAGVAHQLNTPLASALLRAQMLEEDLQNPEQVEDLQFIQKQLRYGKEIVENLLRFSRPSPETKREELFNPILQDVLTMVEPSLRRAKVRLISNLEATVGAVVAAGRNELQQVFFNLCSNALDAMPQGGQLTLATLLGQDRHVALHCQDTGTGIPQARLSRIFEPFYTTKEPGKGTGLGLAISRRIIEDAGGSIEVVSEMGRGTTFTIRLPLARVVDRTPNREQAPLEREATNNP